ncbi:hypothetical protein A9Q81_19075 [Gammaproteobacteria bacterium 42_54_T18]|nr:hypothetical protein A9Q81_19075 [Gammaproteobacteria bacterium 42_54_T18]
MNGIAEGTVETVFVALQAARGVKATKAGYGTKSAVKSITPVLFGELVHYVHGTASVDESKVRAAISRDLVLRRQFYSLLESSRVATAPSQAQAASGEPLVQRKTRAFTLVFKPSRANADQIYVLLTVHAESGMADGHRPVIIASLSSEVGRLQFPPLKDQSAQLLLEVEDKRLVIVQNADAELSLI